MAGSADSSATHCAAICALATSCAASACSCISFRIASRASSLNCISAALARGQAGGRTGSCSDAAWPQKMVSRRTVRMASSCRGQVLGDQRRAGETCASASGPDFRKEWSSRHCWRSCTPLSCTPLSLLHATMRGLLHRHCAASLGARRAWRQSTVETAHGNHRGPSRQYKWWMDSCRHCSVAMYKPASVSPRRTTSAPPAHGSGSR